MKQGITLQELAAKIEHEKSLKHDFVVPTARLSVFASNDGDENQRKNIRLAMPRTGVDVVDKYTYRTQDDDPRGGLAIRPIMHGQFSDKLGIPKKYADRMLAEAPELLAENFNHWLANATDTKGAPAQNMVRTLDGSARAFLSKSYNRLDNADLVEAALPAIYESGAQVESCEITERRMYLKCIVPNITEVIWPDGTPDHLKILGDGRDKDRHVDIVRPGISIGTSEVGFGKLFASPAIHTEGCSNLAIMSQDKMAKVHLGRSQGTENGLIAEVFSDDTKRAQDEVLFREIADLTRAALGGEFFLRYVDQLKVSRGLKIETTDLAEVVDVTAEKFNLADGERDSVLSHLIQGGDLSAYGLSNAITRASQDVEDYDRASDMEKIGGEVIELDPKQWAVIGMTTSRAAA